MKPDFKDDEGEVRVSIIENPMHGVLQATDGNGYYYFPDTGYIGKDQVTFLVEMGGRKYKAVHYVQVMEIVPEYYSQDKRLCPKGGYWKISFTPDANGNSNRAEYRFPSTSEYA